MKRKPAEFFLETLFPGEFSPDPSDRYILWEPLTSHDLAGLTLLTECGPKQRTACDQLLTEASAKGFSPQRILSAVSPDETAGLLLPERKLAVYTARRIEKGLLPDICERKLERAVPQKMTLEQKAQLKEIQERIRTERGRAARLLKAAKGLLRENELRQRSCMYTEKVVQTAERLFRRECANGRSGEEQKRFLTALTGRGFVSCETVPMLCDRVILIEDPFGAAAALLTEKLRECILKAGQGCISCYDPLEPERVVHLLLPELRLGFLTLSPLMPAMAMPERYRSIHYTRFCDMERLEEHRQKLRFTKRMAAELLREAESAAAEVAQAEKVLEELLPESDAEELVQLARMQME